MYLSVTLDLDRYRSPSCLRLSEGDPLKFEVIVREGKGETRHHVTMAQATCARLTAGKRAPEAVEALSNSCLTGNRKSPFSDIST